MTSYDKEWYAPNGGKFTYKNLNAKSEHPNPWRPATLWESQIRLGVTPMNLTTFTQPTMRRQTIDFEEAGLARNLQKASFLGFRLGTTYAVLNIALIKESLPVRQVFGRWAYLASPFVAMTTSYVAIHEVCNMMSAEKNQKWMYFADGLPAGFIWGVFKRSFPAGFRMGFFTGLTGLLIKSGMDMGLGFGQASYRAIQYDETDKMVPFNDPVHRDAKTSFRTPNSWKKSDRPTWPVRNHDEDYRGYENVIEPSWKKHIPEEDRNKGPPTNY